MLRDGIKDVRVLFSVEKINTAYLCVRAVFASCQDINLAVYTTLESERTAVLSSDPNSQDVLGYEENQRVSSSKPRLFSFLEISHPFRFHILRAEK